MPLKLYESTIETLEIMGDEDLMASFRQAIQEMEEGKTVPWEQVKKELNLDAPNRGHSAANKPSSEMNVNRSSPSC